MFSNRYPIIVCYAIALHYIQSLALLTNRSVAGVTSIYTVERILGDKPALVASLFFAVASLALYGLLLSRRWLTIILMLPQQFFLLIACFGAIDAVMLGRFADGVERSRAFLLADQSPAILTAIGHTIAILALMERRTWSVRDGERQW